MEVVLIKLYSNILIAGAVTALTIAGGIKDNAQKGKNLSENLNARTTTLTTVTEATTEATTNLIFDTCKLSNTRYGWYYMPNKEHKTPAVKSGIDYKKYNAYYVGDTQNKVIYLTFDEGYENGYTSKILDILKNKQVKAAFFVTEDYIKRNPQLIKRMQAEGHTVGNHSSRHLSSPELSDNEFSQELTKTANTYKEITGYDMPKIFRPPMGDYSERTLALAHNMGYKTIFWSFAYKDWETDNQPGKDVAYNTVMERYHNGAILLLHAVSSSNTEALPDIIDSLKAQGYSFETLNTLQ